MTKDTEKALEVLRPVGEIMGVELDADDDGFLYCNGQAIGISCNSTYATVKEFIAYCMVKMSREENRYRLTDSLERNLKRYWSGPDAVQEIKERRRRA